MGRKTKDSGVDGLLVVDKPAGWTSHDVVAKARGAYGQRRAGHSGTLDPDATGVLLIGFGQVTRLLPHLTALRKTYTCEIVLGATTSTLDDSGNITATFDMAGVTLRQAQAATANFVGNIHQIPPMVSAVQVGGVRLHELARQGIEIERAPRPVTVYRYDVSHQVEPGIFAATVECGSGTYVRTLAADLGAALGGGAHLRNLRRTHVGSFDAAIGIAPGQPTFGNSTLLSPAEALRDYDALTLTESELTEIRHGRAIATELTTDLISLLSPTGELIAVGAAAEGRLRPTTVIADR